jgi:hypothetical protein
LPAETVPPVTPAAVAASAVPEEDPAPLDLQDSPAVPETPDRQEPPDNPANLPPLLASSQSSLHADLAQEASPETPDLKDSPVNLEPPDSPELLAETLPPAHLAHLDHLDNLDNPDTQEAQDNPELLLPARTLLPHHQAHQESKDLEDPRDSLEPPDSLEPQDSPAQRDLPAHLEAPETMDSPVSLDPPDSPDTPASPVSARNTAPSTEESSSPTAPDVLKRRTTTGNDESHPGDNNIKSFKNNNFNKFFESSDHFTTFITVIRIFLLLPTIDQSCPFQNYKFIL